MNFLLAGISSNAKARIISSLIEKHSSELEKAFGVIIPCAIRIRKKIA